MPSSSRSHVQYQRNETGGTAAAGTSTYTDAKWLAIWRVICAVMTVFFALCAFVQPVYFVPVVLCALIVWDPEFAANSVWRVLCVAHIACCLLAAAYIAAVIIERVQTRLYNPLEDEEGRELAGVLIIIVWLCVCRFSAFGKSSPTPAHWSRHGLLILIAILGLAPFVMWSLCFIEAFHTSFAHCSGMFPGMLGQAYH